MYLLTATSQIDHIRMRETTAIPNTIMYLPTIIQQMRETTTIPNNNLPPLQPNKHPLQVFTTKRVKRTTIQITKPLTRTPT